MVEEQFQTLLAKIRGYNPEADFDQIKKAWEFAKLAHGDGKRPSGELWTHHVLKVAANLANWKLDTATIVSAILHDTIFAGAATREDLEKEFSQEVLLIIDGVTQIDRLELRGNKNGKFVENLRKIILVLAKDVRVILLRLSDRLENMKVLWELPGEERIAKAQETLEIYAPLAERLGIGTVKGELEDLAFPDVYPDEYKRVIEESKPYFKKAENHIKAMKRKLLTLLAKEGSRAEIHGRKKHLYSLWKKLDRPEVFWDFSKVHDIVALRILVNTVPDCYTALGAVHATYKPVPYLGVSDFIAQPKPNGYQSIHTRVFGAVGQIVEIQIRTYDMHAHAEYGIAAHWEYAQIKSKGASDAKLESGIIIPKDKILWVRQLVQWQKEITDSAEFLEAVKFDALENRIFVFSPNGDVFDLPQGATPIDFAYAVHTDLGDHTAGAKVDGKLAALDFKLKSGQVVEIVKNKTQHPNPDWLNLVVTATARRSVKRYLRKRGQKA